MRKSQYTRYHITGKSFESGRLEEASFSKGEINYGRKNDVATVVARRHAHCNPTTASVDNLQFKEAVHLNNTLIIEGKLTYVGRTSMEVRVDTFVESLSGARKLVNTAYVVMVALDENEHPMEVPGLLVETDEEKAEWEAGVKRNDLRKHRRAENY